MSEEQILRELSEILEEDMDYESGRILGSMCTKPHPLAVKVFQRTIEKNLGDPLLFPGALKIEREVIRMLGTLLHNPDAHGNIVTGGTEANIMAIRAARNMSGKKHGKIIVPESAHVSFDKAAELMGLKIIRVPLTEEYIVDLDKLNEYIDRETIAIVGIAGTTGLGVVDPIDKMAEIATDSKVYLHVDAAFGGLVLPFLEMLGYKVPIWDFRAEGVMSITVDPHKMGMAPIPAGGILFRSEEIMKHLYIKVPYLAGGAVNHATIVGTRSGASVIATWALFKHLGIKGYMEVIRRCMKLTEFLASEIERTPGAQLVRKPIMNIVGIKFDSADPGIVDRKLRERGWALGNFGSFLRVVIMPHIRKEHLVEFVGDLREILENL